MNPLDRKLTLVFKALHKGAQDESKNQKASKEFGEIRGRIIDEALGKKVEFLFNAFSRSPTDQQKLEMKEALDIVHDLRERGFVETSALLFAASLVRIEDFSLEQILAVAPNSACIKAWIQVTQMSPLELESRLLLKPVETYATAGAEWLIECAKPDSLLPLLELFLNRQPRPNYLPSWKDSLVASLKKDKRGNLLSAVLKHQWPSGEKTIALAEAVRSDRSLFRMAVDLLPIILVRKDANPSVVSFTNEIFHDTIPTDGAERELMTVLLARLGTGVLLAERKSPQSEAALDLIQKINQQLRNLTREEMLQSRTWLLDNLCQKDDQADGKLHITPEGARYLALAFEKAAQGFSAKDILTATARNLGLTTFGKKGDEVKYDPLRHEDVDSGMLPGEIVRIEEAGWAINQGALIRAKVKRPQGEIHV